MIKAAQQTSMHASSCLFGLTCFSLLLDTLGSLRAATCLFADDHINVHNVDPA